MGQEGFENVEAFFSLHVFLEDDPLKGHKCEKLLKDMKRR